MELLLSPHVPDEETEAEGGRFCHVPVWNWGLSLAVGSEFEHAWQLASLTVTLGFSCLVLCLSCHRWVSVEGRCGEHRASVCADKAAWTPQGAGKGRAGLIYSQSSLGF